MKQLNESKEAKFPIGVPDPVLQNDVQRHGWAETQFLKDQVTENMRRNSKYLNQEMSIIGEEEAHTEANSSITIARLPSFSKIS
jgi:hypothetical protein